jgi:hypothetical protein
MRKAKEKIAVLDSNGRIIRHVLRVPHTIRGFSSYRYHGELLPGYWSYEFGAYIKVTNRS